MTYQEFIEEWNSPGEFISVHTSGSTGTPKEIRLAKDFVAASGLRTIDFFNLDSSSRLHSCISPDFIGGKMMAVRALLSGARLSWESPSNAPFADMEGRVIDLAAVVPSQMGYVLDNPEYMPVLKAVIIGGSPIDSHLKERIVESGLNAWETYGMTETASHIALRRVGEGSFSPLPGISVSTDERGCLEIAFDSGERVVTNDLASLHPDGSFIIEGRIDNMIISGGRKINPSVVERLLGSFIRSPFIVKGIPDEKWGQRVVALVENAGLDPVAVLADLKSKADGLMPGWMMPKEIIPVSSLPRTASGKPKR